MWRTNAFADCGRQIVRMVERHDLSHFERTHFFTPRCGAMERLPVLISKSRRAIGDEHSCAALRRIASKTGPLSIAGAADRLQDFAGCCGLLQPRLHRCKLAGVLDRDGGLISQGLRQFQRAVVLNGVNRGFDRR